MGEAPYTTQLGAGLGLIAETVRLLDLWEAGMSGQRLLRIALESGAFATISARRLRNIIIEAFAPRYLVDGAQPARLLKILQGRIPQLDLRQILFLYTSRANPILADFIREVYWQRYGAGAQAVTKDDARSFIRRAVGRNRTTTRWAELTIIRVSNYLLGICADFGLLGTMQGGRAGHHPVPHNRRNDLRSCPRPAFQRPGRQRPPASFDWGLFGLEPADVFRS